MHMKIEGRVGPNSASDGVDDRLRLTRELAQVVQTHHAKYTESATRGQLFTVSTGVAGVAHGTALSTTPPIALCNPSGSGVYLVLIESYLGYVSGTLGAGSIVYGHVSPQATTPTGGTALAIQSANIGGGKRTVASAHQGSTLAATPVLLKPAFVFGPALATTPAFPSSMAKDEIEGAIVVAPGNAIVMAGVATAGTTPLVMFGLSWEEVPV
jgi:hypothetical protein